MTVEKIDLEIKYDELAADYKDLNNLVIRLRNHNRYLEDEVSFLRACLLKAVGGANDDT